MKRDEVMNSADVIEYLMVALPSKIVEIFI